MPEREAALAKIEARIAELEREERAATQGDIRRQRPHDGGPHGLVRLFGQQEQLVGRVGLHGFGPRGGGSGSSAERGGPSAAPILPNIEPHPRPAAASLVG